MISFKMDEVEVLKKKLAEAEAKIVELLERLQNITVGQISNFRTELEMHNEQQNRHMEEMTNRMKLFCASHMQVSRLIVPLARRFPHNIDRVEHDGAYIFVPDEEWEYGIVMRIDFEGPTNKYTVSYSVEEDFVMPDYPKKGKIFDDFDTACSEVETLLKILPPVVRPFLKKKYPEEAKADLLE